MKHLKIVVWFDSSQVMWYMKPSTKNIVYKLLYKFGNYGKNLKMSGDRAQYLLSLPEKRFWC